MKPTAVLVVEPIDCQACKGTGYEPGHEPTEQGKPYRFCATCQGLKVRHRAMPLEEFAKLFEIPGSPFAHMTNFLRVAPPRQGEGVNK